MTTQSTLIVAASVDGVGGQPVLLEGVTQRGLLGSHGLLLHLPTAWVPQAG